MAPLALITGSTGFIGSKVAQRVLEAGFRARLVIRRAEQAEKLRRLFTAYADSLEFSIVPDMTASGCYDLVLQDVEFVLHLASPLPSSTGTGSREDCDLLAPAVKGTASMLEAAERVPSVRKVVVTGSVLSLVPLSASTDDTTVVTDRDDIDLTIDPSKVSSLDHPMAQYHASKLAAHKATLDIAHERRPAYDIVTMHPVFVFGRSLIQESADDLAGSPGLLFKSLMSENPLVGEFRGVHVDDVAEAHVRALRTGITGLRSYLLAGEICSWVEVNRFARERYPLVPFQLKPEDDTDTGGYRADASRAEAELGIRFKGMEEQVADVVEQQLDFRGTF